MPRSVVAVALVFLIGATILALTNVYFVQTGVRGDLLWSADEAYLFIDTYDMGWRTSWLGYGAAVIKQVFHVAVRYDDTRSSVMVVHFNSTGIRKDVVSDRSLDFYTPFEGAVYANDSGTLLKLVGNRFEPASREEQQKFRDAKADSPPFFTNVNGWSKQLEALSGEPGRASTYPMMINGKAISLAVKHIGSSEISVELVEQQATHKILHMNQDVRRVSRHEYETIFR